MYYVKAGINFSKTQEENQEVFAKVCLQPQIVEKVPLTSGNWSVSYHAIKNYQKLVFFHGYKDTPLGGIHKPYGQQIRNCSVKNGPKNFKKTSQLNF